MIPVIDTHTHLDFSDFDPDRDAVIERAVQAGVSRMLLIATRPATLDRVLALCGEHRSLIPVLGFHPGNVDEVGPGDLDRLRDTCRTQPVAAIGECGLDYHRPPDLLPGEDNAAYQRRLEDWKTRQKTLFRSQLDLAVMLGLNVVVHQRDSWDDCLDILRNYTGRLRAVFHCFGGTPEQVGVLREMGHLVSFTGIVTFKNALTAQASAAILDEEGFMVETDCPYLAPVPHRGKRCEPAFVCEVVRHIARLRRVDEGEIARITNRVAHDFFRLS